MDSRIWRADPCVCERSWPWSTSAQTQTGSPTYQSLSSRKLTPIPSTPQWHLKKTTLQSFPFMLFFFFLVVFEVKSCTKMFCCWNGMEFLARPLLFSTSTLIQVIINKDGIGLENVTILGWFLLVCFLWNLEIFGLSSIVWSMKWNFRTSLIRFCWGFFCTTCGVRDQIHNLLMRDVC